MKRNFVKFSAAAVFFLSSIAPVSAFAASYEVESTNSAIMGNVSVSIEQDIPEYAVIPGRNTGMHVSIRNNAEPIWVRASIEYESHEKDINISDDLVTVSDGPWEYINGYYYYTEPVKTDTSVSFIEDMTVPPDWGSDMKGLKFDITVNVDAVQEANFTPDFNTDDPWFGTVIEASTDAEYTERKNSDGSFSIAFKGGAEGLVKTGDNFFSNWPNLMPGDVISDRITLKNDYSRRVEIFFRSEALTDSELAKAIGLTISNSEGTVYSGTLADSVSEDISVAELYKGDEEVLTYTVSVPDDLGNDFAMNELKTKWIFTADVKSPGSGSISGSYGGGSQWTDSDHGPGVTEESQADLNEDDASDDSGAAEDNASGPIDTIRDAVDTITKWVNDKIPDTGEGVMSAIPFIGLIASSAGLAVLKIKDKKKEDSDEINK